MKIIFKQEGKNSYIYRVSGTTTELAEYRETQGANLVEETNGTPLFFLSKQRDFIASNTPIELREMRDGTYRYMPVNTEQSILMRQAMERAILKTLATPPTEPVDRTTAPEPESDTEPELDETPEPPAPTPVKRKPLK